MSVVGEGPAGPVRALLSRWWLGVLLIVVGVAAGFGLAATRAVEYSAESRLTVGADDLASYQVAGFAQAAQQLASNYARYVDNSSTVSGTLRTDLGDRVSQLVSVSASPIPGSSVISVQTVASSRDTAVAAARSISQTLARLTGGTSQTPATLLAAYDRLTGRVLAQKVTVNDLQTRLDQAKSKNRSTDALQTQLSTAQLTQSSLTLQQSAAAAQYQTAVNQPMSQSQLTIIQRAAFTGSNRGQTTQIYVAAGAVGGLVVALILATLLERRSARKEPGRRRARGKTNRSNPRETALGEAGFAGDSARAANSDGTDQTGTDDLSILPSTDR